MDGTESLGRKDGMGLEVTKLLLVTQTWDRQWSLGTLEKTCSPLGCDLQEQNSVVTELPVAAMIKCQGEGS